MKKLVCVAELNSYVKMLEEKEEIECTWKWTEEAEIIDALRLQVKIMKIIRKLSKPKASLQPVKNPVSKGHAKAPADNQVLPGLHQPKEMFTPTQLYREFTP